MTNEEKAEEYKRRYPISELCVKLSLMNNVMDEGYHFLLDKIEQAHLDGLAEGRKEGYEQGYEDCRHYAHDYYKPKWHDLRKDPNDLPSKITWCSSTVVNQIGTPCHYNYDKSYWENWNFIRIITPIAWCELPKFEE